MLRREFFSTGQVQAIVRDYRNAGLPPAEVALMAFAEKVVLRAHEVTAEDVDQLRGQGFSDDQISDIVLAAAYRCLISKVFDAHGGYIPSDWAEEIREALGEEACQALQVGRDCF